MYCSDLIELIIQQGSRPPSLTPWFNSQLSGIKTECGIVSHDLTNNDDRTEIAVTWRPFDYATCVSSNDEVLIISDQ